MFDAPRSSRDQIVRRTCSSSGAQARPGSTPATNHHFRVLIDPDSDPATMTSACSRVRGRRQPVRHLGDVTGVMPTDFAPEVLGTQAVTVVASDLALEPPSPTPTRPSRGLTPSLIREHSASDSTRQFDLLAGNIASISPRPHIAVQRSRTGTGRQRRNPAWTVTAQS